MTRTRDRRPRRREPSGGARTGPSGSTRPRAEGTPDGAAGRNLVASHDPQVPAADYQVRRLCLGVADAESEMNGAPHTPDFAADERAIGHGVRAMAGLLTERPAALSGTGDGPDSRPGDPAGAGRRE